VRIHTVEPVLPSSAYRSRELLAASLSPGNWVVSHDGVGILTGLQQGIATVMLTDAAGRDRVSIFQPVQTIRRARYTEIPAPRRPAIDRAEALGYERS
jgi:hypothetical protein